MHVPVIAGSATSTSSASASTTLVNRPSRSRRITFDATVLQLQKRSSFGVKGPFNFKSEYVSAFVQDAFTPDLTSFDSFPPMEITEIPISEEDSASGTQGKSAKSAALAAGAGAAGQDIKDVAPGVTGSTSTGRPHAYSNNNGFACQQ